MAQPSTGIMSYTSPPFQTPSQRNESSLLSKNASFNAY
jgi:hypothetical protein